MSDADAYGQFFAADPYEKNTDPNEEIKTDVKSETLIQSQNLGLNQATRLLGSAIGAKKAQEGGSSVAEPNELTESSIQPRNDESYFSNHSGVCKRLKIRTDMTKDEKNLMNKIDFWTIDKVKFNITKKIQDHIVDPEIKYRCLKVVDCFKTRRETYLERSAQKKKAEDDAKLKALSDQLEEKIAGVQDDAKAEEKADVVMTEK